MRHLLEGGSPEQAIEKAEEEEESDGEEEVQVFELNDGDRQHDRGDDHDARDRETAERGARDGGQR